MERFTVEVRTPSRLHFGLMELCADQPHRYAGLGVMLERPGFHLKAVCDSTSKISDSPEIRAATAEVQDRMARLLYLLGGENCAPQSLARIDVLEELPLHSGLGSGTQLACAVAALVELVHRIELNKVDKSNYDQRQSWKPIHQLLHCWDAARLAARAGRGLRSAIGAQGFLSGGLILDRGVDGDKAWHGQQRVEVDTSHTGLPADWRIVLLRPDSAQFVERVSGEREIMLLKQIASRPNPHRQSMLDLADRVQRMVRHEPDFDLFTSLLSNYLEFAAEMFVPIQGGRFNGQACAQLASAAEQAGLAAVGQSSWGPTIFGWSKTAHEAEMAAETIQRMAPGSTGRVLQPAAVGAMFRFAKVEQ